MLSIGEEIGHELYAACQSNNVSLVRALTFNNSSAVSWTSSNRALDWSTVLSVAASEGATDVAAYCVERGALVNRRVLESVICSSRSEPVYRLLVESEAVSVHHYMDRRGHMLDSAAYRSRHSLAQFLLERGADPNLPVEARCLRTVFECAAESSDERMLKLLLDHGARLQGSGALVVAAHKGKMDNVKFLLAQGADVDAMEIPDPHDPRAFEELGTPLHKAVERGHVEVMDVLLQAGADVTLKDAKGRTAADIAEEVGLDAKTLARLEPGR